MMSRRLIATFSHTYVLNRPCTRSSSVVTWKGQVLFEEKGLVELKQYQFHLPLPVKICQSVNSHLTELSVKLVLFDANILVVFN